MVSYAEKSYRLDRRIAFSTSNRKKETSISVVVVEEKISRRIIGRHSSMHIDNTFATGMSGRYVKFSLYSFCFQII